MAQDRILTYRAVTELRANPRNPRKHKRKQLDAIARSISSFGFNAPILVDRNGQVIAGHGRMEAAKLLGLERVPVIGLDDLTEAQAKAYTLADNKLTDRSDWDESLLAIHLKELSDITCDFEIEDTGFETPEIDFLIQGLDAAEDQDEADIFQITPGLPVSRLGDLWTLGKHRIYCGDALQQSSYSALLGDERAAGVFTDPPYNVKIGGHASGLGRVQHREFAMASGEMSQPAFTAFLSGIFSHCINATVDGALIYVCMDWRHIAEIELAATANSLDFLNLCVWVKPNGGMGALYRSRHELVFVFRNGSSPHRNNVQLSRFGRNRTKCLELRWRYQFPPKGPEG